jgi:hypothetical protein
VSSDKVLKIEISFPVPVKLPDGLERAIDALADMVCKQYERENPTMVMWPAGQGAKITSMGVAAGDEHIDFDHSVFAIDCSVREDYYGENQFNPEREQLRAKARAERQARKAGA